MLSDQERERVAEKAPVWVQDIIYRLDRQLYERDRQIALLSDGPEDSNVRIRDHVYPDRPLGVGTTVDFLVSGGFIQVEHSKHNHEVLEVRAVAHGMNHSLALKPTTGNSFKVWLTA